MFNSIFDGQITITSFLLMALVAVLTGIITSFILSFALKSSKRFFVTNSLLSVTIAIIVAFVNGENIGLGAGVAIGGAFGLTRFRSAQGTAEEIGGILITSAAGIAFGMGYLAYGVITSIVLALIMLLVIKTKVFERKNTNQDKLVRVTISEDVNYVEVFEDTLKHYTSQYEYVKVKTSDMGALFKVSIRVVLKNNLEEKEMLDELRQKNGNLEVQIMPYVETNQGL